MRGQPEDLLDVDLAPPKAGPSVHLADYWAVVVRWRLSIAMVTGVSVLIAMVVSLTTKPMYRATTLVDVEKDKGSPLDIGSGQGAESFWASFTPEFLPTQVRAMKSRDIAERVVRKLSLSTNPEFNPPSKGVFGARGVPSVAEKEKLNDAKLVQLAQRLQGSVEASVIRGTNIVELSYVASSPQLAADVANAVSAAYIEWSTESRFRGVGQASQFLASQIEQLRAEIEEREARLQAYGRSKDIVSSDPQANVTLQKLSAVSRDYSSAVNERIQKEARYYQVKNARPETLAESLSGGLVESLRGEQLRLERDYAEKMSLFKSDWPPMLQLKAQIDKGQQHLKTVIEETVAKARETAKSEYETALRREESQLEALNKQKAEAMTLNTNAVEYNNLSVEITSKRALMDSLFKRQSESEVSSRLVGSRENNVRVLERAVPPGGPFLPSYRKNLMLGLILGIAGGIGLAFFMEYMDRSIRRPEQVEKQLGLPALGVIPALGEGGGQAYGYGYGYGALRRAYGGSRKKSAGSPSPTDPPPEIELLPHFHPRSVLTEAYRSFRAALLLSHVGGVKTIVVTSAVSGEGKTTTALNLAVVLAQLGRKVLLVDADLHRPRIHEALKVPNQVGLVSILAQGLDLQKATQETLVPDLSVLVSGPRSPNPSGLLASEAMRGLLDTLGTTFDYLIIDSPPVQAVADALILGNMADGVVICVRGGATPIEQVASTRDRLLGANVQILGLLINNLREPAAGAGRYYAYHAAYYGSEADTSREKRAS